MTDTFKTLEERKEEHILNYVQSLAALEEAMEPFKEQKRALKTNYVENGWLDKDEISMAVKAFRMIKNGVDPEQLMDFYETVKRVN
jgi:dihydroxyacetone kinase|tara:strand:- start:32750 stop:33007 length:258 start_codon:yes stop_codon:yes gene_type:complete